MRIGSLFSGIGGLELGLEQAIPGAHTVWQVEKDPYARQVLARHWPRAWRYENVKEVGAHNLESVDIICGGFPCQDISHAGKQAGLDGERSGLWFEFARVIREIDPRPRFVVVENVSALRTRGLGTVLGDLASLGYDSTWDCVPAQTIGAPHQRDRMFIVAYRSDVSHADSSGFAEQRWTLAIQAAQSAAERGSRWTTEPDIRRVADGVPHRVDRLRCLGNAVCPPVAQAIGNVINQIVARTTLETTNETPDERRESKA